MNEMKKNELTQIQKETIELMDGTEILYKDIGCVGIDKFTLVRGGKVVEKITKSNYQKIMDAYNTQEYGTTDMKVIMDMEGF